ncbi:hypothetical protein Tco_0881675 [Tanacetum coccineum]
MAREDESKNKKGWLITGNGRQKQYMDHANRVNHANKLVPRSVQINAGRPNINTVRPNINTGMTNINSVRPNINTGRTNINPVKPRVNTGRSNVNTVRFRQHKYRPDLQTVLVHKSPQGNWGSAVKTSSGYNEETLWPNSNYDSGPTFIRTDHPLKNMVDRGIFDSGMLGHMTGNKDQWRIFKEFNGGIVNFRMVAKDTDCFDMRPYSAKSFASLIAKAKSDESKLWNRKDQEERGQEGTPRSFLRLL